MPHRLRVSLSFIVCCGALAGFASKATASADRQFLQDVLDCEVRSVDACEALWTTAPTLSVASLTELWPYLGRSGRAHAISRTEGHTLEEFIFRHIDRSDPDELSYYWTRSGSGQAKILLARSILEGMREESTEHSGRFAAALDQHPIHLDVQSTPYFLHELEAWHHLIAEGPSLAPLWQDLQGQPNAWISLFGSAGLIATDQTSFAQPGLKVIADERGRPPATLLHLLGTVESSGPDAYFAELLRDPDTGLDMACAFRQFDPSPRFSRIVEAAGPWVRTLLENVPVDDIPSVERLRDSTRSAPQDPLTRDIACAASVGISTTMIPQPESVRLARWLVAHPSELYQMFGVIKFALMGHLQPLEDFADAHQTANPHSTLGEQLRREFTEAPSRFPVGFGGLRQAEELCLRSTGLAPDSTSGQAPTERLSGIEGDAIWLALELPLAGPTETQRLHCDVLFGEQPIVRMAELLPAGS